MLFVILHFIAGIFLITLGIKMAVTSGNYYLGYFLFKVLPIILGIYMLAQSFGITASASPVVH